ncbi:uncharacterized protein B0H18DRAFT_1043542 [Fomitopsis serialis]|uniref:uncharacterized protein n=1 Tax=Fomitopsis serialis TaxID=139415 RepID=UPI0020077B12|nr:uncharacterized protein B0H18DRAFT_1043542 [Neoantrodia serialis]KAH9914980.1 hypothetical protein B0H18DRAFT_1043542 [Neoantrodia serialis]
MPTASEPAEKSLPARGAARPAIMTATTEKQQDVEAQRDEDADSCTSSGCSWTFKSMLGYLQCGGLLLGAFGVLLYDAAVIAGMFAFIGFAGLTLGHGVLSAIYPGDLRYAASIRSTMQVGAVGSAVLGAAIGIVFVFVLIVGDVDVKSLNAPGARRVTLVFYTAIGAASGALGVAILEHNKGVMERGDMLNRTGAARAGAFGWFLLAVSVVLSSELAAIAALLT